MIEEARPHRRKKIVKRTREVMRPKGVSDALWSAALRLRSFSPEELTATGFDPQEVVYYGYSLSYRTVVHEHNALIFGDVRRKE